MQATAIYIHVPFCHSKCAYCDFYSIANFSRKDDYVNALCDEIRLRALKSNVRQIVSTIYFGGGTPSLLTTADLFRILMTLIDHFDCLTLSEFTIECNPEDVTHDYVSSLNSLLRSLPDAFSRSIRLSVGLQSFNDRALRLFKRRHTASQNRSAIRLLQDVGFENISADLIFAYPEQTIEELEEDLQQLVETNVQHVSTYILSIEQGTLFHKMLQRGDFNALSDSFVETMYHHVSRTLREAGFDHYEISNFAKRGFQSKHNSAYWSCDIPYLGFGPAAHSYDGCSLRTSNVSNLLQYIHGIQSSAPIFSEDRLTEDNRYDEFVMTRLRTREGIHLLTLRRKFGNGKVDYLLSQARPYIQTEKLHFSNEWLRLTSYGIMISDSIFSDLMK